MKFGAWLKKHLGDIITITLVVIMTIGIAISNIFLFPTVKGTKVEVYYRNRLVETYNLSENREIVFCRGDSAEGHVCDYTGFSDFQGPVVILEIKDEAIRVINETSKKKLCSTQGTIKVSNTPIICLPNSFMAVIVGKANSEFDN